MIGAATEASASETAMIAAMIAAAEAPKAPAAAKAAAMESMSAKAAETGADRRCRIGQTDRQAQGACRNQAEKAFY